LASQQHTIRSFERKFDPGSIITAEHLRVFADGERANESCCQAGSLFDCKGQCKWKWSTKSATAGKKINRDKIYNPWCVEEKIMQNVHNGTLDIAREREKTKNDCQSSKKRTRLLNGGCE